MPEELPPVIEKTEEAAPIARSSQGRRGSLPYILLAIFVVLLAGGGAFAMIGHSSKNTGANPDQGKQRVSQGDSNPDHQQGGSGKAMNSNATDPEEKGRALSGNMCTGKGSKELTSAPLAAGDIGVITPMGTMIVFEHIAIDHVRNNLRVLFNASASQFP